MRTIVILCVLVAAVSARPEEKYTDKYDNIDIDEILNNKGVLRNYFNCIIGDGKCTAEGKELKSRITEALENDCMKCTDHQKKESRHVISHLINNEPKYWSELSNKYDPTGKYAAKYENELKTAKKN